MDDENTSRPPLRRLAAVLAGALLLAAACGSSGDDDDAAARDQDEGEGQGGSADGAFPVTVEHRYGTTTVEAAPERIVTVGLTDQDALLALGVAPVATTEWFGEYPGSIWPWAQDALEELDAETPATLGDATALNVEAVAAQDPDLILALYAGVTEQEYEQLSAIAPTVAQPEEHIDFGIPWDEMTRTVGRVVGKADAADAVVADVEARFAAAREAHPEFDGATAVMATPYEGTLVYGAEDPRGRFLTALGFVLPAGLDEVTGDEFTGTLSPERVDLLDVDAIVWLDADDAEGPLGGPLYSSLPVHEEGREVHVDSFEDPLGGATSFVTPLSLPFLIDGLVPMLATALDGDPATEVVHPGR